MYRFGSVIKYKGHLLSLKNIKDIDLIYKNSILTKELNTVVNDLKSSRSSEGFVKKITDYIISSNTNKFQSSSKVLTVIQNDKGDKNTSKNKHITSRFIRKEVRKLYHNLQNTFSKEKSFIATASGLSLIDNVDVKSSTKSDITLTGDVIPEPPPIPSEQIEEPVLNALGESTFESLGLGGYSPVGIIQNCFEYLHVTLGVEWWVAIAIGTLVIRTLLFPLVIIAQRNAARMNNYLPQMQLIQLKLTEARQSGNQLDAARYAQELMLFMKDKQLNPLKNMIVPLAQMPIFVSFFMALRQMANVPVDSLRTGGLFWFTDLTLPDQFYLLPIITSATLYATIELGTDSAKLSAQNMQIMKYVLRGLPLVILPFIVNFPGAILCYWVSSNFISLIQVSILRVPTVRDYFKIEPLRKFNPENLPMKPKGFTEGIKDSWDNVKLTKELEARRRLDEIQFQRAGKGPIVKTYKYDPTKQTEPTKSASISAKKWD